MGVVSDKGLGGYIPVCETCGVALCWGIAPHEYEEDKKFWDDWQCRDCDPNADGSRKRYRFNKNLVREE